MAYVDAYGSASLTSWPPVAAEVFVKTYWADDWTWIPYIRVKSVEERAAPGIGTAEFEFDFGTIGRAELCYMDTYDFLSLEGCYVAIMSYNIWEEALLWTGVVDVVNVKPHGTAAYPQGEQTFTAYELSHLLDRITVHGAYTENGFIDRPVTFNKTQRRGLPVVGNRSTSKGGDGAYYFAVDGEAWTAYTVAEYLLTSYVNGVGPTFVVVGATDLLDYIQEVWDLEGSTVREALDRLIDRRRGVNYCIVTNGTDPVYIYVYSTFAVPVAVGDVLLEPNWEQWTMDFTGLRNANHEITFNRLTLYDQVVVKGGPVYSCFTLSYADATLEEGWTAAEETAYLAGSDETTPTVEQHDAARAAEEFRNVFQKHRVPDTWNGYAGDGEGGTQVNVLPFVWLDGYVDSTTEGTAWKPGAIFERELPLAVEGTGGSDYPEYRRPFVLVKVEDGDANDIWVFTEKLRALDKEPASVDVMDTDLALMVEPSINHVAADGHWTGAEDSATEPEWDYEDIIATVNMRTDEHLVVVADVLGHVPNEVPRVKMINVPDAEAWFVASNTVEDVVDGALVTYSGDALVRDDSSVLREIAALALAWYGMPRATLHFEIGYVSLGTPVGSMISGTEGPEGYTDINTVVTSRTWRFDDDGPKTIVQTGFEEIDFREVAE